MSPSNTRLRNERLAANLHFCSVTTIVGIQEKWRCSLQAQFTATTTESTTTSCGHCAKLARIT